MRPTAPLLLLALLCSTAHAQPDRDPEAERLSAPQPEAPVVRPVGEGEGVPGGADETGALDALAPTAFPPSPGQLLAEGTFLYDRQGIMRPLRSGGWAFIFDEDEAGEAEPPMILMPSRRLAEMERLVEGRSGSTTLRVSGQVFVYEGRNYLLPISFGVASLERPPAPAVPEGGRPETSGGEGEAAAGEPGAEVDVEELLERLERARPIAPPAVPRDVGADAVAGDFRPAPMREGATLVSRRGRVERGLRDGLVFAIDTDADAAPGQDAPMVLLPSLNLEDIERLADRYGQSVTFVMSGRVFAYRGENYLLPTLYLIERSATENLTPLQ